LIRTPVSMAEADISMSFEVLASCTITTLSATRTAWMPSVAPRSSPREANWKNGLEKKLPHLSLQDNLLTKLLTFVINPGIGV
jgi:hypothetical protein